MTRRGPRGPVAGVVAVAVTLILAHGPMVRAAADVTPTAEATTQTAQTAQQPIVEPVAHLDSDIVLTPSSLREQRPIDLGTITGPDQGTWYLTRSRVEVHIPAGAKGWGLLAAETNGKYSMQIEFVADGKDVEVKTLGLWDGRRSWRSPPGRIDIDFRNFVPDDAVRSGPNTIAYQMELFDGMTFSSVRVDKVSGVESTMANPYELMLEAEPQRLVRGQKGEVVLTVVRDGSRPPADATVTVDDAGRGLTGVAMADWAPTAEARSQVRFPVTPSSAGRFGLVATVVSVYGDYELPFVVTVVEPASRVRFWVPAVLAGVGLALLVAAAVRRRRSSMSAFPDGPAGEPTQVSRQ